MDKTNSETMPAHPVAKIQILSILFCVAVKGLNMIRVAGYELRVEGLSLGGRVFCTSR